MAHPLGRPQRDYWHFYWPLALMGVVAVAGGVVQNRVLLGLSDGIRELALFTLALAAFGPFRASLIFVPQMANVLVRGPRSFRSSLRFVLLVGAVFTTPVVLIGWTEFGDWALQFLYRQPLDRIELLRAYFRYFTPLIPMAALMHFFVGMLVQARRTGTVTLLRTMHVAVLVGVLAAGVAGHWPPMVTICASMLAAGTVHLVLAMVFFLRYRHECRTDDDRHLGMWEIASFFLPLVGTTICFSISRPIIYGFLTALNPTGAADGPDVDAMVSAVKIAFTFNFLFQAAINQFRNLLVTFGHEDPTGVRRFMRRVTVTASGLLVFCVVTPLAGIYLRVVQGADVDMVAMAGQALWPMCLAPIVVAWRNYNHGMAMVRRRTWPMVAGGLGRNLSVLAVAPVLAALGLYNHVAAAAMLILAFGGEAATVSLLTRWRPQRSEQEKHDGDGDSGQDGA